MTRRDSILPPDQMWRANILVVTTYRRMYHDYRRMSPELALHILNWTLDDRDGREAWRLAVKVVTTPDPDDSPWRGD